MYLTLPHASVENYLRAVATSAYEDAVSLSKKSEFYIALTSEIHWDWKSSVPNERTAFRESLRTCTHRRWSRHLASPSEGVALCSVGHTQSSNCLWPAWTTLKSSTRELPSVDSHMTIANPAVSYFAVLTSRAENGKCNAPVHQEWTTSLHGAH